MVPNDSVDIENILKMEKEAARLVEMEKTVNKRARKVEREAI